LKCKSVIITKKGRPDVLRVVERDVPAPGPGQVRVLVRYCGVGFTDVIMRLGYYPYAPRIPFAPGYEIIGVVESTGPGVLGFARGDRVVALTVTGGYSECMLIDEDDLVPAPAGIEDRVAVAVILNYATAYQMLHRAARVRPGERVLYTGASGGVGTALLQLGRVAELEMYGLTSRPDDPVIGENGGTAINYKTEDVPASVRRMTSGRGVDAAFDGVGGSFFWSCRASLAPGGRLISYGFTGGIKNGRSDFTATLAGLASLAAGKLLLGGRSQFFGVTALYRKTKAPFKEDLAAVFSLLREGKIKPRIAAVLPLSDARRANELLERGGVGGKLLLKCSDG
jgi:NADPH2:quinone reductase